MKITFKIILKSLLFLPFFFALIHQSDSVNVVDTFILQYSNNWLIGVVLPSLVLSIILYVLVNTRLRDWAISIMNGGPYLSILIFMLFVWLFVTVEVGLRSFHTKHTPSPFHVGMNYLGYRGSVISLFKSENDIYVAAIGGSTTYGNGVDWWEAWPAYTEDRLNAQYNILNHKRFHIANLGLEAAGLDCGIRRFEHFDRMYDFDVLVIHAGYNGLGDWCQLWLPINTRLRDVSLLFYMVLDFVEQQEWYTRNSFWNLNITKDDEDWIQRDTNSEFINVYLEFVSEVLSRGIKVVTILQPGLSGTSSGDELKHHQNIDELKLTLAVRADDLGLRLVEEFNHLDDFVIIDLTDVPDKYKFDSVHLNANGNKYISEFIASSISNVISK